MKTLTGYLFLYDKDCPLCTNYTRWFVQLNLLEASSRVAFQDINQVLYPKVDFDLAQNKVALVDIHSGEAIYGLDAMNKVLGHRFPFLSFVLKFKLLYWFFEQVYTFISMNRKVFIPVSCNQASACNPSRSWFWRFALVLLCLVFSYCLVQNSTLFLNIAGYFTLICGASLLIFQYLFLQVLHERNGYDYLGHASITFFLSVVIFVLVGKLLQPVFTYPKEAILGAFCAAGIFFFVEHARRMKKSDLDFRLTFSAALFFLLFIFLINTL